MPLAWVIFDLNGTLVDPSVLAQPLGDSVAAEELVADAFDDAIAQAMLATLIGEHPPFPTLIEAALRRRVALAGGDAGAVAAAIGLLGSMPAFIEAPSALEQLRGEGLRLGVLTQSATQAAEQVLRFAGLRDRIELVLGADETGAYKPAPQAYRALLERVGATAGEVCLVAAHWWDVAGARRAGLRTGWVARRERLLLDTVPEPDVRGRDLAEVAARLLERR
ncbi:MAG: 2-haloacid dehalogenase [Solirubrobacteraceae bacterium]|jgi:2-haloacid dehalogenase|nr:2-haloacid dehalogenase [Solirubrobacteraceae bacterium]